MSASVKNVYTSVGCNRTPHSLDWGNNGLICYAASHSVAIYDPKHSNNNGKLLCTVYEHSNRVNCVKWIQNFSPTPEKEFVSGASDKSVIIWSCLTSGTGIECVKIAKLTDLDGNVNSVDGINWEYNGNLATVAVASGDNKLCVWLRLSSNDNFSLLFKHTAGSNLLLDCKIHLLPSCLSPVIACACDDGSVQLFNLQLDNGELSVMSNIKILGHEDWVRKLAFTIEDSGDLLLASASQDSLIRVVRISPDNQEKTNAVLKSTQGKLSVKYNGTFLFKSSLETVLQGHDNWVYGLHWQQPSLENGSWKNPLRLLSCSMDKTMIIWGMDKSSGMWLDQVRVGEVGGNTLGLYGCCFGNNGLSILAHGYQGALHLWNDVGGEWKPGVVCGGHFSSVEDLIWDPLGEFIISVSSDQTSRLHAPWVKANEEVTWHELCRPQVHGYDLSTITSLGRFRFASGAEEKVIRVFEAPINFLENFARICQIDESQLSLASGPQGASVPALGLSNKPVYQVEEKKTETKRQSDMYVENTFTPSHFEAPPTEETLLQNTLWPEIHKLYGHGYELFSLASDPQHQILVSSSRAQQAEHAAIIVWNAENQTQIGKLNAHTLTVTQMAFSPDGKRMVSVSRDRTWAVHEKMEEGGVLTMQTIAKGSGGSRILWSCEWSPDSKYFVTGSRDKRVIIWARSEGSYSICGQPLECQDSVTAVTFGHEINGDGSHVVAVGLDNGQISLYKWNPELEQNHWNLIITLDQSQAHHLTVKRLRFRPLSGPAGSRHSTDDCILLASCGADHTVKIHRFNFKL